MGSQDDLEQFIEVVIWQGNVYTAGKLDVMDRRNRLIEDPMVDSAVNKCLFNVSFEQVHEMSPVRAVSYLVD